MLQRVVTTFALTVTLAVQCAAARQVELIWMPGDPPVVDAPPHILIDAHDGNRYLLDVTDVGLAELHAAGFVVNILATPRARPDHPTWTEIETRLSTLAANFPSICRLVSIGESIEGRHLWVMMISDNPDVEEDEPEFKYVANMHGDETTSQEMAIRLIDYLLTQYGQDNLITRLVNETEIHILPIMNPDGYVRGTRVNAPLVVDGVLVGGLEDLNRNFPSPFLPITQQSAIQPETAAVIGWTEQHNFVLSAGLHSGAFGVVYPWGHDHDHNDDLAMFPETELSRALCRVYADNHPTMHSVNQVNSNGSRWENGIINGAEWYVVNGEMADWNYRYHTCIETTIELSYAHSPAYSEMDSLWEGHRPALLAYMTEVHRGIRGRVTSSLTGSGLPARVYAIPIEAYQLPPMSDGWNALTIPISPLDSAPATVFPNAHVREYVPYLRRFTRPVEIVAERGYWVRFNTAPGVLTLSGVRPLAAPALSTGWNFVGPRSDVHAVDIPAIMPTIFTPKKDSLSGQFTITKLPAPGEPHHDPNAKLQQGTAYWIQARSSTTMLQPNTPAPVMTDRGGTSSRGDYYRLLLPGPYQLQIDYAGVATIAHIPFVSSLTADSTIPINAAVTLPHGSKTVTNVTVPNGNDNDGIPNFVVHDVTLPCTGNAQLHWRIEGEEEWQNSVMTVSDGNGQSVLPGQISGTVIVYYLTVNAVDNDAVLVRLPADTTTFFTAEVN